MRNGEFDKMKNVAIFDWDKTIRKNGYVIFDFIGVLVKENIIDKSILNEIEIILKEYTEGKTTDTEMRKKAVQTYRKIY